MPVPELKNMVVLDSKDMNGVIAHSGGEPPKEEPKSEVKAEPEKEQPEQEAGESDDDYAKRLGLSKEQHEGVTETIKKAVGKKHRQYKEAEEFAKHEYNSRILAEERAAKAERELQRIKASQTPAEEPAETAKPERKNFKTDDEYIDALTTYKAEQAIAKKEKEQQEKAREDVQRERAAKYDGQMAQARALVPDFQETMESVEGREDLRIPDAVSAYLFNESDKVPEVLYHLIKTPEVLESLWKMSPMRQVIEIGKIEGTLKSFADKYKDSAKAPDANKASPTATAPSKARAPAITPITQGSESQVSGDKDESFETAFEKYRSTKAPNILRRKRH